MPAAQRRKGNLRNALSLRARRMYGEKNGLQVEREVGFQRITKKTPKQLEPSNNSKTALTTGDLSVLTTLLQSQSKE